MPEPLVTVAVPVYNAERYVSQCLETLVAQTFRDFRVVIVDNASTDETEAICRAWTRRDSRLEYHRNPTNIGMAGNYNRSFALSRSKYFRWAPADDYCSPDFLEAHVAVLESDTSLALCYSEAWFVDAGGQPIERWSDDLHLTEADPVARFRAVIRHIERVHHHLGLMRADFVRQTGGIRRHVSSDMGFVAEMSLLGKFHRINEPLFFRRMHEDSSSWSTHDEEHQKRRYHATAVKHLWFNRLRFHLCNVQIALRSPALSASQRLELVAFAADVAFHHRANLAQEAIDEVRRALHLGPRSSR